MARSRKNRHHKRGFNIPLAIVAGFAPLGIGVWQRRTNIQAAAEFVTLAETGFALDGTWHSDTLRYGLFPQIGGLIVHKIANKMGVNRAIRRAIPFISI